MVAQQHPVEVRVASAQLPASAAPAQGAIAAFASQDSFVAAQRMATLLSSSTLVPKEYQGNMPNCLIAIELSSRIGASVFMVMQHLHVIQGRPSFGAQFVIATANACGRFTPLRFEWSDLKPDDPRYGCRAVAVDKASGEVLEGDWVTWEMVKGEGWLNKPGSKWKTMPGQMFRYRAASYWAKVYAPELLMGMQTEEEVRDIVTTAAPAIPSAPVEQTAAAAPATAPAPAPAATPESKRPVVEVPAGMSGLEQALGDDEPKPNSPEDVGARPASPAPAPAASAPAPKKAPPKKAAAPAPAPAAPRGFEPPRMMTAEELAAASKT